MIHSITGSCRRRLRGSRLLRFGISLVLLLVIGLLLFTAYRLQTKPPVTARPASGQTASQISRGVPMPRRQPSDAASVPVLGVYAGPTNVAAVDGIGVLLGHKVAYAMDFLDGCSWGKITQPDWPYSSWSGRGYHMIWGVPMLPGPDRDACPTAAADSTLGLGATGEYNGYFTTVAQNLVASGQAASVVRLGWEFNDRWAPWAASGQAAAFVAYWRQIVTAMRAVPGQHFQFEWNPTLGDLGTGNPADDYPGDAYVDIIGEDVYDNGWNGYPGCMQQWQALLKETYGLNWFADFAAAHRKFMAFPEWGLGFAAAAHNCSPLSGVSGLASGGDDAYFVRQIAAFVRTHHFVHATVWNYGSAPLPDARAYPRATAAFTASFQ